MKKNVVILVFIATLLTVLAGCAPNTVVQVNTPVPKVGAGTPAPNGRINVPGVSIQVYAPGPNPLVNTPDAHGRPASLVLGIWHGVISPVTIILSLLKLNAQMYEVHNDGSLYNLGFFVGVVLLLVILSLLIGGRR